MANFGSDLSIMAAFMGKEMAKMVEKRDKSTDMWGAMVGDMAGNRAVPSRMSADSVSGTHRTDRETQMATEIIRLNKELFDLQCEGKRYEESIRQLEQMVADRTKYNNQLLDERNFLDMRVEQLEGQLSAYRDPGKRARILRQRKS